MRAIKLEGHINSDRTLHLSLPEGVSEGPAEVIVLVEEGPVGNGQEDLRQFLDDLDRAGIEPRSKEAIDRYIQEERNSWD